MKRITENIRKEIYSMELINTAFIYKHGILASTNLSPETINRNIFIDTFTEVELKELFSQKIFGRN